MEKRSPSEVWGEQQKVNLEEEQPSGQGGDQDLVLTWDEFINNTTIHGVKYIFDRTQKVRR